ncbi:MAG: hypothetical protein CL694_10150 [Chloroflexi bacterium]|nr:hypothetical protein [Chloroflexota bacterium]MDP6422438.1 hypothetical protein [SAR202 cluster bacterium]HAL46251.1 hypothetical protein [Dehalococcoidia bacterium]
MIVEWSLWFVFVVAFLLSAMWGTLEISGATYSDSWIGLVSVMILLFGTLGVLSVVWNLTAMLGAVGGAIVGGLTVLMIDTTTGGILLKLCGILQCDHTPDPGDIGQVYGLWAFAGATIGLIPFRLFPVSYVRIRLRYDSNSVVSEGTVVERIDHQESDGYGGTVHCRPSAKVGHIWA